MIKQAVHGTAVQNPIHCTANPATAPIRHTDNHMLKNAAAMILYLLIAPHSLLQHRQNIIRCLIAIKHLPLRGDCPYQDEILQGRIHLADVLI